MEPFQGQIMEQDIIKQFTELDEAFHARSKRSERLYVRFAALAALSSPLECSKLVDKTLEIRDTLNEELGVWRSPGRAMRIVFAASLASTGHNAKHFLDARNALLARRSERGGRSLSQGGSCAALALVVSGGHPHQADNFYDTLEAIAAPWWRRDASREETLAAAFVALGEAPDDALGQLNKTRQCLLSAGIPKHHANAAAYEVALLDPDHGQVAGAWTTLNLAVRGRSALKHGVGKTGLAVLSAQGDGQATADALVNSFEAIKALRPRSVGETAARLAMRLAQLQNGQTAPTSAARDLAAILAAQSAMVASVVAATSATNVATAS